MNLNCYDDVEQKVDKTRTWIIPQSKTLSTHEMKYRPWSCLMQTYDKIQNDYHYYIAMSESKDDKHNWTHNYHNTGNRIRINLTSIWNRTSLHKIEHECNIDIKLVDSQDDGEIYEIIDI